MSAACKPDLSDVRFRYTMFLDTMDLDDVEFRAVTQLAATCAARMVWTYTEPGDGGLVDDDQRLARIACVTEKQWRRVRPTVAEFFTIRNGRWHFARDWLVIDAAGRAPVPLATQREVAARQGRLCTYCGDTEGPFHFEHIYPVSKGGTNDASNLTLACGPCNLSKGDKTLAEWIAAGGPPRTRTV